MRFNEIPVSIGELGTDRIYVLNASQRTQLPQKGLTKDSKDKGGSSNA